MGIFLYLHDSSEVSKTFCAVMEFLAAVTVIICINTEETEVTCCLPQNLIVFIHQIRLDIHTARNSTGCNA